MFRPYKIILRKGFVMAKEKKEKKNESAEEYQQRRIKEREAAARADS